VMTQNAIGLFGTRYKRVLALGKRSRKAARPHPNPTKEQVPAGALRAPGPRSVTRPRRPWLLRRLRGAAPRRPQGRCRGRCASQEALPREGTAPTSSSNCRKYTWAAQTGWTQIKANEDTQLLVVFPFSYSWRCAMAATARPVEHLGFLPCAKTKMKKPPPRIKHEELDRYIESTAA
jgi:hypothetical protein